MEDLTPDQIDNLEKAFFHAMDLVGRVNVALLLQEGRSSEDMFLGEVDTAVQALWVDFNANCYKFRPRDPGFKMTVVSTMQVEMFNETVLTVMRYLLVFTKRFHYAFNRSFDSFKKQLEGHIDALQAKSLKTPKSLDIMGNCLVQSIMTKLYN